MKKKTELAPSELRANHSLKGTIKGPGPAKIIFKKKIQQKEKTLRSTYKNEIGANYLRGDQRDKTNPHPSPHESHTRQIEVVASQKPSLTAFFLQCFNLKKGGGEEKREKGKRRKRKKENLPIVRPPIHPSFKVIHYALITTGFQAQGAQMHLVLRGSLPASAIYMQSLRKISS